MGRNPSGACRPRFDRFRKLDFLTHPLVVAFNDWRYGTQNGKAEALGHDMAGTDGVPHAERLIDAQAERARADRRGELRTSKEAAHKDRQGAELEHDHAGREVAQLDIKDAELAVQESGLGRRHGPGPLAYGLILVALFGLTLPLDYSVASWLELPPLGQWLLTVSIGLAMLFGADQAAKKIEELEESHAGRERLPFAYRKDQLAVVAGLGTAVLVLVVTALWRGQILAAEANTSEVPVPSGIVSLALGALAGLAFVVAVIAGMGFRRMKPLREARKARAQNQAARAKWQAVADQAARRQGEAEITLVYLDEREQQVTDGIGHWAEERKARLRQRAAWVSSKERRKQTDQRRRDGRLGRSSASIG